MARIEQPVEVDDEITHVGVIDRLLGLALPSGISGGIVREQAHDIDLVEILEGDVIEIEKFATDNEVKQLRLHSFGHEVLSQKQRPAGKLKQKACSQSPRNRVFPKMFHDMRVPRMPRRHQQPMADIGLIINQALAGQ